MNGELMLYLCAASIYLGGGLAGYLLGTARRNRTEFRDAKALAERADENGRRLCECARWLRQLPGLDGMRQVQAHQHADALERAAVAHLKCINAIGIDSLAAVGGQGGYLGEFTITPCSQLKPRLDGNGLVVGVTREARHAHS